MPIIELLFNVLWQFLKESISFSLIKYEKSYFSLAKMHNYLLTRFIISFNVSLH